MPDVKIKGYSGVELPFADVPKVWLAAPESTEENPVLLPYTYGEALDGVEVEPDFSGGDMQVTVPEGYLLRSGVLKKPENLIPGNIKKGETVAGIPGEYEGETVELEEVTVALAMADGDQVIKPTEGKALGKVTLTKPETLVPENIAEGVNIAGVIGALVAGGAKYAYGTTTEIGYGTVINHGLGVIPDIILVSTITITPGCIRNLWGISSTFRTATGWKNYFVINGCFYDSSNTLKVYTINNYITANNSGMPINNANETSFVLGSGNYKHNDSTMWIAIGGLT